MLILASWRLLSRSRAVLLLAPALFFAGCSGSPTAPATPVLKVTSISPAAGSTTGGTMVTVIGTEFGSDATLTVGGVVADKVVIQGATTMTAIIGAHAAGTGDVVVTSGGKSATLPRAFTFDAPTGSNQPPVVAGIRSQGGRPNQPATFADLNDTITLVPTVFNAETTGVTLTYAWSGPGTFSNTTDGTTMWHLPATAGATPSAMTATLVVSESFTEGAVTHMQASAPGTFTLQVHDSRKEILDMGEDFLTLFSQSSVPTSQVLHNFSTTCDDGSGRADEESDVNDNRHDYTEDFSAFRITRREPFSINFGGTCYTSDGRGQNHTDACSSFAVHWESTKKSSGVKGITNGVDFVSAVLENNQWKLCHSSFVGTESYPTLGITKAIAW
jgi:hypothetical protein